MTGRKKSSVKCVCWDFFSVKRQCEEKEQRLAVLEENFSSTQKEVAELRSCLREVERSRLEARRELQELRRQVSPPLLLCGIKKDALFAVQTRFFFTDKLCFDVLVFVAPAEGSGWRKGTEREGGG